MTHPEWTADEGWKADIPFGSDAARESDDEQESSRDLEPGWRAIRALMQLRSDELLAVMLRPSFRPVRDMDLVPVTPCLRCMDGGMRTAGTVRVRRGRVTVRACDTCSAVDVSDQSVPSAQ